VKLFCCIGSHRDRIVNVGHRFASRYAWNRLLLAGSSDSGFALVTKSSAGTDWVSIRTEDPFVGAIHDVRTFVANDIIWAYVVTIRTGSAQSGVGRATYCFSHRTAFPLQQGRLRQ
jgi:hypothetical protein